MRKFLRVLVGVVWATTLFVAILWVLNPEDPKYAPITCVLGLFSSAILAWKPAARWVKKQRRTVHLQAEVGEQFLHDHKKLLWSLNDKNVEYILIGGFTSLFYGGVIHNHDLDVWIGHKSDNHQRLKEVIQLIGFDTSLIDGVAGGTSLAVRLGTAPIDLYLQESMMGTDFYSFYRRRKVFVVDDMPISVMSQRDNRVQTSYKFDPPRLHKT